MPESIRHRSKNVIQKYMEPTETKPLNEIAETLKREDAKRFEARMLIPEHLEKIKGMIEGLQASLTPEMLKNLDDIEKRNYVFNLQTSLAEAEETLKEIMDSIERNK